MIAADRKQWDQFPSLAFDVESTGLNPHDDRIVTAALVKLTPGQRPHTRTYVINPAIPIHPDAAQIHGYTNERAQAEATHAIDQALYEITGELALWVGRGWPVVAYNAPFDLSMLEAENHRHNIPTLIDRLGVGKLSPILDPLVLDKHADKFRKGGRKLVDVCNTYGVRHTGAHDAAGDALAAARLWPRILMTHPTKFRAQTLPALHQSQVGWRADQMTSLRAYFDRQGTAHDGCPPDWPLLPAPVVAAAGGVS